MGKTKSDLMWQTPKVNTGGGDCPSERNRNSPNLQAQVNMEKNWATPQAFDCVDMVRTAEKLQQTRIEKNAGCMNLREQVHYPDMDHSRKGCKNWRTPAACEGEGGVKTLHSIHGDHAPKIKPRDHVNHEISETSKKKLNPDWVEQLQGLPVGWTQLSGVTNPNENRVDRLRLLGNGVVPQTAEKAFRILLGRILK